jgi:hypothetical protein
LLTNRDSRIENHIEWLEVRRETIDGVPTAEDIRSLLEDHRALQFAAKTVTTIVSVHAPAAAEKLAAAIRGNSQCQPKEESNA